MSRFKFRVFDNGCQKMHICGEDIHDSIVFFDGQAHYYNLQNGESSLKDDDGKSTYELMQFTGLKDVNGREIYEGDILTGGILHMTSGVRLSNESVATTVTFRDGMFKLGKVSLLSFHKNAEVIGNIYENPELLEVTE